MFSVQCSVFSREFGDESGEWSVVSSLFSFVYGCTLVFLLLVREMKFSEAKSHKDA